MFVDVQHMADGEGRKRSGAVDELLDLEPQHGQGPGDVGEAGVRFEVLPQPTQRELHRARPPVMVGTSRGAKP